MTGRYSWIPVALLGVMAPVLVFPAVLGPAHGWMAAMVGIMALVGAAGLLLGSGRLGLWAALFSFTVLVGWSRAAGEASALDHFCGVALGLFAMGTVAAWCRTVERLALGALVFLLGGMVVLSIGSRSTSSVPGAKAFFRETTAAPVQPIPLPLPSLHQRESVNRNALAATAMMILPVAAGIAAATAPVQRPALQVGVRLAGVLSAVWALVIVVTMQSRSAWLSAAVLLWLQGWRRMRPAFWLLAAALVFLAVPVVLIVFWSDQPRVAQAIATLQERMMIWHQGLQAWRPSPWFGIGLDYFRHSGYSPLLVWPDAIVGRPHAHNMFLQTALDVGIVGLVSYLAVIGLVMRRAFDLARLGGNAWTRRVGVGAALSVLSVHIYGVLDAVALGTKVGLFQWLSCGLVLAAWRIESAAGTTRGRM